MSALANPNPYLPELATVQEVIQETPQIKTIRVRFDDDTAWRAFTHQPGQVGQLSVFGAGESTFVIASPPSSLPDYIQFSVLKAGENTSAIHKLKPGDKVGVRGPRGNWWPLDEWKGKDVFFVGGGIGMAPIRTVLMHLLEQPDDYGKLSLLFGCRSPADMPFKADVEDWLKHPKLRLTLTVDGVSEEQAHTWKHRVGLIPMVLKDLAPNPDNCVAALCGPPIMIKFTLAAFRELGFKDENIYTTLERRMKCGIGICGRCNLGGKYICLDGPVFSQAQLNNLPPEM